MLGDAQLNMNINLVIYKYILSLSSVFFRDETVMEDILEKQADQIRYLKEHNSHLGKKVLKLTAELKGKT